MKENLLAISLVILFTLVYSCSDNSRQRRLDREAQRVLSNAQIARKTVMSNQHRLFDMLADVYGYRYDSAELHYAWPLSDQEMMQNRHLQVVKNHHELLEQADNLCVSALQLNDLIRKDSFLLDGNEVIKLNVQVVDLMKQSKKLVRRQKSLIQELVN